MNHDRLTYRVAFGSLKGVNPTLAAEFLARCGTEEAFFSASSRQLSAMMGFNNRVFADDYRRKLLEAARRETDFIFANNIRPLYFTDPDYPQRLLEAQDAPVMLYALGQTDLNAGHMLAVVGTRHATSYGCDFVARLLADVAARSAETVTVISGLAFGIDAAAHSAALRQGLPTAGVLAHGLNMIYPAQHRSLASDMVRKGSVLLTEYRSDAPVHKGNFIARNRIVAALCDAIVVVESARKGGALITARLAAGYDRDVLALPGRTSDRYSQGCNHLIASHTAALIQSADDLFDTMRWRTKEAHSEQPSLFTELSDSEQAVVDFLTEKGDAHLSQLTMALNMPVSKMMALLIDMEFKNLVLAYPGGRYRLA